MLSTWNRATVMMGVAMLLLAGCGKDKPAEEGNDNWTKKAGDLQTKLADVKKEQETLNIQLATMPAAANTDSAVTVERSAIETALNDDGAKVGEIETMLSDDAARREKLKADGDEAYGAAWKTQETKYNDAMTALEGMQKRYGDLKARISNLDKVAAGTGGGDTNLHSMPSMNGIDSGKIDTSRPAVR